MRSIPIVKKDISILKEDSIDSIHKYSSNYMDVSITDSTIVKFPIIKVHSKDALN